MCWASNHQNTYRNCPRAYFPFRNSHDQIKDNMYIIDGPDSYESKRKQKLANQDVFVVEPITAKFLQWSMVPINFDGTDHLDHVPHPWCYL
jgi:hypothetical protein